MIFNNRTMTALQAGLDAQWMSQKVHANNIANYDTPNYKAKTVDFQELVQKEYNQQTGKSKKVYNYVATVSEDSKTVMRLDGSNVDMEKEQLQLWQAYAQYSYLQYEIDKEFDTYTTVLNKLG